MFLKRCGFLSFAMPQVSLNPTGVIYISYICSSQNANWQLLIEKKKCFTVELLCDETRNKMGLGVWVKLGVFSFEKGFSTKIWIISEIGSTFTYQVRQNFNYNIARGNKFCNDCCIVQLLYTVRKKNLNLSKYLLRC